MRVLIVLPGIGPEGGAEQSLAAVVPTMLRMGLELHVAVLTSYQTMVSDLDRAGVQVHDLSQVGGPARRILALRRLCLRLDPHVVHATLWQATTATQLALIGTDVPVLLTWAVTPSSERGSPELVSGRWKRVLIEVGDAVLGRLTRASYHAVTPGVAAAFGRRLHVPPERIFVGERGRDPAHYAAAGERAEVRLELGVPQEARLLLAVGRQDPQKNYPAVVDAFEQVSSSKSSVWLAIAGREGAASADLVARRVRSKVADRILVLGHRDDIPRLLAAADVVVCASWREGAAGALLEAMASGTPVVSVPLIGLQGILVDGVNARVVARDALARGVLEILDDPEAADRLVLGGRLTAEQRFSITRSADRMVEIYETVAKS